MADNDPKVPLPDLENGGDTSVPIRPDLASVADLETVNKTAADLEAVFDVPVQVSAVLGRSKMDVGELLKLGPGTVLELDRRVGEAIDIYVNNAGQSTRGPSETLTDEQWQADLDLKLFAQIRFCRLVFPQMKERRWGRIISVLNIGAKAPGADSAPTSVSRAAQMAFTKALSQEGAPHNVLVNSLHVGVIVSDQIVRRHAREGANVSLEDFIAQAGRRVPLGRMGRAEEFANIACFLASDAASYVTGCAINVDGGSSPVV